MAQLGIKVSDEIKDEFCNLATEAGRTQPEFISDLLVRYKERPAVSSEGALNDLQKEFELFVDNAHKNAVKLKETNDEQATEINTLRGLLADKDAQIMELKAGPQRDPDLTSDIKELSQLSILSKAIYNYVAVSMRRALKGTSSLTTEKAVEMFIKVNGDK